MDSSTSLLQPLLGLLITFTVLGLVLWGVKALQNKRNIFGGRTIQVIEAASVGTRERIVIADVSGRRLVMWSAHLHSLLPAPLLPLLLL